MNTLKELNRVSKIVKKVLIDDTRARNSDARLYRKVIYQIGMNKGIDVGAMSVTYYLEHMKQLGFPAFETISRARRKIQAKHPELAGDDDVVAHREINEQVYREYAKR